MKVSFMHILISSITIVFSYAVDTKAFISTSAFQGIQISGTVQDDTGQPIPGVNVIEKGTTNGMASDTDGRYSLVVSNENATLVFSPDLS
jgi:hypothetical protein